MPDVSPNDRLRALQRAAEFRRLSGDTRVPLEQTVDQQSGAPATVRAAVGAAVTPEDRLGTLRQFFPDAQPYQDGNFVFTDPSTGRPTLYNPPGLDFGDLPSVGPEISEFAGGVMGGVAAVPAAVGGAPFTGGASLTAIPLGVGLGAAAGREGYNALAETTLGTQDTRGLPEQLIDTAVTVGGNAVGQRVGDLAEAGIRQVIGPMARRPFTGTTTRQLTADYANLGINPTPGAITGNRGMQLIEQGIANTPGGASVLQRSVEDALETLSRSVDEVAEGYTRGAPVQSRQQVGETIQGAAGRAVERFTGRQNDLYGRVYDQIPADSPAPVPAVMALRGQLTGQLQRAPQSQQGQIGPALREVEALIADASAGGGIPFQTLRQVRTDLGRRLGDPLLVGENSAQRQYLQRVYGALSDDMNRHAVSVNPGAAGQLHVADRYTRFNMNRNIEMLNDLIRRGAPEEVYSRIFGGGDSTVSAAGRIGGSQLTRLRRNFQPEEWDLVSGSVLSLMGRARPAQQGDTAVEGVGDVFSPSVFITRWNQMSPEARIRLFGGTRYADLAQELNGLVRVTSSLNDASRMANPSGTARNLLVGAGLTVSGSQALQGDYGSAAATIGGGIIAPRVAAKLITSPKFVNWLTRAVRVGHNGGSMTGEITRLVAVAEANPEIRAEIGQYLDSLRHVETLMPSGAGPQDATGRGRSAPPAR